MDLKKKSSFKQKYSDLEVLNFLKCIKFENYSKSIFFKNIQILENAGV
jgi:hypothetical protein